MMWSFQRQTSDKTQRALPALVRHQSFSFLGIVCCGTLVVQCYPTDHLRGRFSVCHLVTWVFGVMPQPASGNQTQVTRVVT